MIESEEILDHPFSMNIYDTEYKILEKQNGVLWNAPNKRHPISVSVARYNNGDYIESDEPVEPIEDDYEEEIIDDEIGEDDITEDTDEELVNQDIENFENEIKQDLQEIVDNNE